MHDKGTLDDMYFEWLYSSIGAVRNRNPNRSYWELCKQLYKKEFTWIVRNDENRAEDGRDLRDEFISDWEIQVIDPEWLELGCSVFEMLVALSRRASFETSEEPDEWFWRMLENLDLRQYTDAVYGDIVRDDVEVTLDRVIERTYDRNGVGGLFPLQKASRNQRKVELWHQMSSYIVENHYVDVEA